MSKKKSNQKENKAFPSVGDAGVVAVAISKINNEMTAQEQAFFIAEFSECIKDLDKQYQK
jgi:hypothetical protein